MQLPYPPSYSNSSFTPNQADAKSPTSSSSLPSYNANPPLAAVETNASGSFPLQSAPSPPSGTFPDISMDSLASSVFKQQQQQQQQPMPLPSAPSPTTEDLAVSLSSLNASGSVTNSVVVTESKHNEPNGDDDEEEIKQEEQKEPEEGIGSNAKPEEELAASSSSTGAFSAVFDNVEAVSQADDASVAGGDLEGEGGGGRAHEGDEKIKHEEVAVEEKTEVNATANVLVQQPNTKKKKSRNDYMFANQNNHHKLIKQPGDLDGQAFQVDTLANCSVFLLDHTAQVQVDNCVDSSLFIGQSCKSYI